MSRMKDRLKTLLRSAKNSIKDYSPAERRVRAATSNEPWPPSSRMMMVICHDMNDATVYDPVLVMMLKRLQDKNQVMHVRKALQLVEFCLRHGNRRFIEDMKTRRYIFKGLQTYRFLVHGQDKGAEIRSKAEYIMHLLADETRLEHERSAAKRARSRMQGFSNAMVKHRAHTVENRSDSDGTSSPSNNRPNSQPLNQAHPALSSPSTQSSGTEESSGSISLSDSTEQNNILQPIDPPRKKITLQSGKSKESDPASTQNRGGHPAIPDNPFDPLSSLFSVKSAQESDAFDWIPAANNENDNGNGKNQDVVNTTSMNGGAVAAPQNLIAVNVPPSAVNMAMPYGQMAVANGGQVFKPNANPNLGWYAVQPYQMMPQQQFPPLSYNQVQQAPPTCLALPPAHDPSNPFL